MTARKLTLTAEMARAMYQVGADLPEDSPAEVRDRYERMADAGRAVLAERLGEYSAAILRVCMEKKHRGSRPPVAEGDPGTPCRQCSQQVKYVRNALKVVAPDLRL